MKYCSVFGCYSNDKFGSKRNFFLFPSFLEARSLWEEFCQDPSEGPFYKRYICDLHFTDSDYENCRFVELKKNAIPSQNGPNQKMKSKKPVKSKENIEDNVEQITSATDPLDSNEIPLSSNDNEHSYSANAAIPIKIHGAINDIASNSEETLDQNLDVLNLPSSAVKFHKIDESLKHSLMESVLKPRQYGKRKASQSLVNIPCKTYKSVQEDVELKLQAGSTLQEEAGSDSQSNNTFKTSREIVIGDENTSKTIQACLVSTVSFESEDETSSSFGTDDLNLTQVVPETWEPSQSTTKPIKISGVYSNMKDIFKNLDDSSKSVELPSSLGLPLHSIQSKPTITIVQPRPNQLQKRLAELNETRKKSLLRKYRSTAFKRRPFAYPLDRNNPKYSIAATAESLGTFDSYIDVPLENVDLDAGEWHKLYSPSEISLPKLPESHIGPMVNRLRSRLTTLNDRDKLEVSFLLSLMSAYPNAPKHIKELLFQRLNLVYIATMFKWDTAIALSKKVQSPSKSNVSAFATSSTKNINTISSDVVIAEDSGGTETHKSSKDKKFKKQKKHSHFAFEVIVQEKDPATKEDSKSNNIKTL